jgi:hypothetical protein
MQADPHGRDPHEPGAKLDAGKTPIHRGLIAQFPAACLAVAQVSEYGSRKYTWGGWQTVPDGEQRYLDAAMRHILAAASGEKVDPESGLLHLAHAAWGLMAVLEIASRIGER